MSRGRELSKVGGLTQTIAGISTFVGISTFASDVRIHGKLDVDGDISYDEMTSVNSKITGISTVTDIRVDRNLNVAGIATFAAAFPNSQLANSTVSFGGVSVALGAADATPAFNLADATGYPTSSLSGTITNAQLAGSIANAKLANSTVSFGGISLALGATDATPAFDLQDATGYPTSSLSGTITNAQLAGSIANAKLASSSISIGGVSLALGATDATPAFDLADATNYPTSSLSGTITNAQLAGSIANDKLAGSITNAKLANSTMTVGGVTLTLGATDATPAFDLQDATGYPTSSLTGTISNAQLGGSIANAKLANSSVSFGGISVALGAADATPAFDLQDATGYPTSSLTGTITNAQLAGSIANGKLANSTVSYGGISLALGATDATPAFNLADATGLPISTGVSGLAANVATFLGTPSSANLLAALTDETGTGNAVFSASPTLTGTVVAANLDISGGVDIDGHLDADNVSIAGITTFAAATTFTGAIDANGGATIDNIQIGVTNDNEVDTSSGNLVIDSAGGTVTVDDNLIISGNLTVNGTTNTVNSTTVTIADKNFQVATGAADDAAADGGGLTVDSGDGDKTWNFEATGDNWGSNQNINVATGKVYKINNSSILSATTLGSSVVNSSLTTLGTIATGVWQGTAIANAYLANSTMSVGGVTLTLGATDATPAFNLADATGYPTSSLSGTITNAQLAGSIADSKLSTISTAGKVSLAALEIDGGTDIGADLVDADLFIVDDGAGGTNRKTTGTRIKKYIWSSASGDATASDSGAITLAASGVSAGTVGSSTAIPIITVDAKGRITSTSTTAVDSTTIEQGNTSVAVTDTGTGSIVASVDGSTLATIAAAGITLSSGAFVGNVTGNVTGNTSGSSGSCTGNAATATALATGRTIAATGDISWTSGSFDGSGNVTGTAAISAGAIVNADVNASAAIVGSKLADDSITEVKLDIHNTPTDGYALKYSDANGLIWEDAGTATNATNVTVTANNSTNETVYPLFVDGATGAQGAETDTGLSYNPSTGALTSTTFIGALTGNVTGNVSGSSGSCSGTASLATNVTATANNSTDETVYPTFIDGATGTQGIETDTGLTYNPSTGALTSTSFVGALTGNASGSSGSCTGNAATATALATARTIAGVSFDGTGNISLNNNAITNGAGYITTSGTSAACSGNSATATTATVATSITASANNSTDETVYPVFVDGATGTQGLETDTGLSYNPSTGVLTTTSVTGNLTGNVTGNTSGSSGSCTGNAATATALASARTIAGVSFDGTGNISLNNNAITNGAGYITATLTEEQVEDFVGGMLTGNTESGITVTYQDSDGTIDFAVATQSDENFTSALLSKLNAIEASATADQSASEILTLIKTVDGAGSGLDADTLDGISSASFLRSDASDTFTGTLTVSGAAAVDNLSLDGNTVTTSSGNLTLDSAGGTTTIADDTIISGNLTVNGTTTTINSTTVAIDDKNFQVATGAADDAAADGAGLTVDSGDGDKTWNFEATGDNWGSSENINLASGKTLKVANTTILNATTLGSSVVASSLTSVGTISSGTWEGTAVGNDYIATITAANKVGLSALNIDGGTDIGAALADADLLIVDDGAGGTNRKMAASRLPTYLFGKVSGDVAIAANGAATIQANSVALSTDTTGNYVAAGAVSGNGLSGSAGAEGATFTVTSNATAANTNSTIVYRDGSGDFAAGTITASLTGNASGSSGSCTGNAATATALATARAIGGVNFDGTAAINLPGVNASGNQNTSGNAATATLASTITVTGNNTTNETVYPLFADGSSGTQGAETDTAFSYNPSSNTLTVGTVSGALSGTATNAALLDSLDSSQFVRSDAADTMTATFTCRAITPQADSTYDLGTNSVRWANVYADDVRTGDLHLSNQHRGGNSVDGSWGHYTIQEGEDDLFITNKRSGKKFRFVLEAI